uniref:Uncharacterized protein n=1 Tax=Tetranychus urticae TaxID=32264 RepID=T1KPU9_TETUR
MNERKDILTMKLLKGKDNSSCASIQLIPPSPVTKSKVSFPNLSTKLCKNSTSYN